MDVKIRKVFYIGKRPFSTDKTSDIELIEHSIRDALFDPSNDYEGEEQPVYRRQCIGIDKHGWGYRRL